MFLKSVVCFGNKFNFSVLSSLPILVFWLQALSCLAYIQLVQCSARFLLGRAALCLFVLSHLRSCSYFDALWILCWFARQLHRWYFSGADCDTLRSRHCGHVHLRVLYLVPCVVHAPFWLGCSGLFCFMSLALFVSLASGVIRPSLFLLARGEPRGRFCAWAVLA